MQLWLSHCRVLDYSPRQRLDELGPLNSELNQRRLLKLEKSFGLVVWSIFLVLNVLSTPARSALIAPGIMRIEAFDSSDSASFCDARRFEIVEGVSGVVYSHKPYYPASVYRPGRDCFMTLKAPIGYRLELIALEFQVGERFAAQSRKCAGDSLHIFDQDKPDPSSEKTRHQQPGDYQDERSLSAILSSNNSVASPIKANLCGRLKNNTIIARSTMNIMTLWWHSEPATAAASSAPSSQIAKRGFKLQWTAFRESAPTGCNEEKEFACANQNTCIPVELACDNVAHCSDKSDLSPQKQRSAGCEDVEAEASSTSSSFNVGSLAGICIGALLLLVLALVLFSVCRKRRRQAGRQHKYNQAPNAATSSAPIDNNRHRPNGPQANSNNSTNSSNSDNSRSASSSNDSRNQILNQQQQFAHMYPLPQQQQNNQHYHQIDPSNNVPTANGAYYQPYYLTDNGPPAFQTKQLYHHHHHPQPPTAPPPSMVGANSKNQQQPYYYQQQQQNNASDSRQPMIA